MKIADKRALRTSTEALAESCKRLQDQHGLSLTATIEVGAIESYAFEELGQDRADALAALGKVPCAILDAMGTIAQDADYREAFAELTTVCFLPAPQATGSGFEYDQSASLDGDTLRVTYAPLTWMHGGYERSIKGAF